MIPARPARETGGPSELGRLIDEALRCLESTDFSGANAALKKAHAEAASPGIAAPAGHETAKKHEDRG